MILQHIAQGSAYIMDMHPVPGINLARGISDAAAVFDHRRALRYLADCKLMSLGNILI